MTKDTGSILAEEDPLLNWMWDVMERGNQGDILGPPPHLRTPHHPDAGILGKWWNQLL